MPFPRLSDRPVPQFPSLANRISHLHRSRGARLIRSINFHLGADTSNVLIRILMSLITALIGGLQLRGSLRRTSSLFFLSLRFPPGLLACHDMSFAYTRDQTGQKKRHTLLDPVEDISPEPAIALLIVTKQASRSLFRSNLHSSADIGRAMSRLIDSIFCRPRLSLCGGLRLSLWCWRADQVVEMSTCSLHCTDERTISRL